MLEQFLARYRLKGILLDTNMFVLYLIGTFDRELVPRFKRTSMYESEDFDLISQYVKKFSKIVITPQILAETWNFVEKLDKQKFTRFFHKVVPTLTIVHEDYIHKDDIIVSNGIDYIGVSDMSIILAAKRFGYLIITDDLRAYSHFQSYGVNAVNINHFRTF